MVKMTIDMVPRLKEVNDIIDTCSDGTMSFEQANVIARFYYDYQDTNVIIDERREWQQKMSGGSERLLLTSKMRLPLFLII